MSLKDIEKTHDVITNYSVKCKCSHSMYMPVYVKFKICGYCGRKVYRNKQEEFKDKIKGAMRNVNS